MPMDRNGSITREMRVIRVSIKSLGRALARLAPLVQKTDTAAPTNGTPRRKLKLTPKRRAALKLQGSYLGYMRQLKPTQKAKVRAAREAKGIQAAIRVAKGLAGR